jgi:hypothetical protein
VAKGGLRRVVVNARAGVTTLKWSESLVVPNLVADKARLRSDEQGCAVRWDDLAVPDLEEEIHGRDLPAVLEETRSREDGRHDAAD